LSKVLKESSRTQGNFKYSYFPWFCGYFPGHPRSLPYKSGITMANADHRLHHRCAWWRLRIFR